MFRSLYRSSEQEGSGLLTGGFQRADGLRCNLTVLIELRAPDREG